MKKLSNTEAELKKSVAYEKACIFAKSSTGVVLVSLLLTLNRFSILSVPLVKHVFTYGNDPNLFKVESEEKFNGLI